MIYLSGGEQYVAEACAQVASTSTAWTQVIAPGANTGGVYVARICQWATGTPYSEWRAHTSTPASSADGVALARTTAGANVELGVIVPAGQGIYVASDGASQIFYRVL